MKTLKLFILLYIVSLNFINAQTIVDLDSRDGERTLNTYYKDTQNKLNQFEGTWVYDDGVSYIKFVLIKKYQFPVENYFEDLIVGEFQYKKNGQEIINTLNNLNYNDSYNYKIRGNHFWYNISPFRNYTSDNFRLETRITENGHLSDLDMRTLTNNGQQIMQIFKSRASIYYEYLPIIPEGFYYLTKQ